MQMKRLLAGLTVSAMLFTLLPAAALAAEDTLTRGEARDIIAAAADDYNAAAGAGLLKGDGTGALNEDRAVTRGEVLVMLSRAFGEMPELTGDNARNAFPAQDFTDLPAWGGAELQNLLDAGIVSGSGDTTLSPSDPVTADELDTLIRRIYALEGTNLKDDFYAAVNRQWLAGSVIQPGRSVSGSFYDLGYKVDDDVAGLITEIAAGEHKQGSGEQKIADLYHNILDWDARNKEGVAPIKPYLDAIDAAQDLEELMAVEGKLRDELYTSMLLGFGLDIDLKDSNKYSVVFYTNSPSLTKDFYANGTENQTAAYLTYLTELLTLGGADETAAAREADACYQWEKTVAAAMYDPQDQYDVDKIYNPYTMDELKALFPNVDLDKVYADSGLQAEDTVYVYDPGLVEAVAAYFSDEYVDTLKILMRIGLLISYGGALNREFIDASDALNQSYLGIEGTQPDEAVAAVQVQSLMSDYLGQAYVERYFSAEAKADVEEMVGEFIAIYKERIQALDWMSDTTKAMALKKLDSMGVKVGYPDKWDDYMDAADIKSAADGGSYFSNLVEISRVNHEDSLRCQGTGVDKSQWLMSAYTVNAGYTPSFNDITFPAGILQAPMYDVDAPREKNLGGIGYVIAHEITHAFDNDGSKFDENGNAADWWTEEDYAAFQERCAAVVEWYDGQEAVPGIPCIGALTLSENVADMGSAACVTEAAKGMENPDYETLYRAIAESWSFTASREFQRAMAVQDVHAPAKLRVNRVLQTCDQFYETFDIQPGDGMYVAPEARVRVW